MTTLRLDEDIVTWYIQQRIVAFLSITALLEQYVEEKYAAW